jgi:DNA-binding protein H-NS
VTLRDQILELGMELAARLSSQERAMANARSATTALSRARVERDAVELFLEGLSEATVDHDEGVRNDEVPAQRRQHRASGS